MSSGIDCGKLEEVLESIFRIPIDAAKLEKWVNGGEYETVMLGDKEMPTLRNFIRQIDERESQAAEEEINEAKAEIGALAARIQAKIDELKAMTASAETLPPGHPATVYYNASTGEFEFGIPEGKQGIQGEPGKAPTLDMIRAGGAEDNQLSIIYGGDAALTEKPDDTLVRQVQRTDTSVNWTLENPLLEDGEQGFERTPDGKLLWKIGDGVTHWNDLPYPSILVDKIYRFKGSVATVDDLPADAEPGDVYNVIDTGANYAWTGEAWDNLGVVREIDPAPIRDSGNPVASGGVYAALEKMQQDIAATGAPDELTIIKNESGKLVAKDIAIGGDPTDLASARGQIGNTPTVGPHDFSTGMLAEKSGLYAAYQSGSTNGPFVGPYAELIARTGGQAGSILFSSGRSTVRRAALGGVSSVTGFTGYNRLITEEQIGDGMRVTNGMVSVPDYEGATATEPGTAGLVPPATVEEKDKYLKGDGTYGSGLAASVFTPPTAGAPGKAGLVPGPGATPENEQLLNLLSAKGFMKIDPSALFPSAESAELNKTTLALGGELVNGLEIDQLRRSGWFAGSFAGTLPKGVTDGVMLNLLAYNNSDQLYYRTQLLIAYNDSKLYRRGSYGFVPGGKITSDPQWWELGAFAPKPQAAEGVGQWRNLGNVVGTGNSVTLPPGGAWAFFISGIQVGTANVQGSYAGVAAGGTVISVSYTDVSHVWGFCWRIA